MNLIPDRIAQIQSHIQNITLSKSILKSIPDRGKLLDYVELTPVIVKTDEIILFGLRDEASSEHDSFVIYNLELYPDDLVWNTIVSKMLAETIMSISLINDFLTLVITSITESDEELDENVERLLKLTKGVKRALYRGEFLYSSSSKSIIQTNGDYKVGDLVHIEDVHELGVDPIDRNIMLASAYDAYTVNMGADVLYEDDHNIPIQ